MTNCSRECDSEEIRCTTRTSSCPWVRDPDRPLRYVCLKCGLQRNLRQFGFGDLLLGAIAIVVILLLAGLVAGKQSPEPPPSRRDRAFSKVTIAISQKLL